MGGQNRALVQRIADKSAEVFVQKNSELFTVQAVGSYAFILEQYRETLDALSQLGKERIKPTGESPLVLLEDELEVRQSALKQYQDTLLNLSMELTLKNQDYKKPVTHLNELTFAGGWIGLQDEGGADRLRSLAIGGGGSLSGGCSVLASTPEQASVIQAREQFFTLQEKIEDFQDDSQLLQLNQRLSIKRNSLVNNITQLETAESDARTLSRTLQALKIQIDRQPEFLVLSKANTTAASWQLLGANPNAADLERMGELVMRTEEQNPAFASLTNHIIETRTSLETERERFDLLGRNLELTLSEVQSLEEELI